MGDNKEYKDLLEGMMGDLERGCQPDKMALETLRAAKNSLAHCGMQDKQVGKRKRAIGDRKMAKKIQLDAAMAIWNDVVYPYTQPKKVEVHAFQRAYTMDGMKGYKKFWDEITAIVIASVEKDDTLTKEQKEKWITEFANPEGWVYNIAINMGLNLWDYLMTNMDELPPGLLGNPGFFARKKKLLQGWSKELGVAKSEANVKYGNKVVQFGDVSIQGAKGGTRPSRCVPNVRSLHFLNPEQVKNLKKIGKGMQGEVSTCHILDCPLIQPNVIVVAKRFQQGDKHQKRADAIQEVLMGGLNHRGIIGALAMTIEDPPKLVYDFYNGGDLHSFINKCEAHSKDKGKSKDTVDNKFISEMKVFLENRLGIALALLETVQYLHGLNRIHCDLHFGNILLHFDHDQDMATKVYVGICDFGLSKHLSQCKLSEKRMWPTPADQVVQYKKNHPHMAPELIGPDPATHSKATDVYALGNIFESLLQEDWDGMTSRTRCLSVGWSATHNASRLDRIIQDMMHKDPKKRMDCLHWSMMMVQAFQNCRLFLQNSPYLRD